ncbi:hypothetical protein PLESTF_001963900 [Pleodorina starrii]|nr:hypothetical protein PLESTF_001963900 [Pleodorina starrii]
MSPPPFVGFGSPVAPGAYTGTPMQQEMGGTPFQERVVKTIGKSLASTPAIFTPLAAPAATATTTAKAAAATPSAKEVNRIARVPLPGDAGSDETGRFVSSEDEPAGPASPPGEPDAPEHYAPAEVCPARKGVNLLAVFVVSSIFFTLAIALLLSPCLNQEQYAAMNSRSYERVCKGLVRIRGDAADRAEHLRALTVNRAALLHRGLPPAAADALDQVWATVKHAHVAAWTAASPLAAQAKEHVAPLWDRAQPALQRTYMGVLTRAAPVLESLVERLMSATARPPAAPTLITCLAFDGFLALLDQTSVPPEYLRELWDKAARDVAIKQKATVWLLTCGHDTDCATAERGLLAEAASYIELDGAFYGAADSAGKLQRELVRFLRAYPDGLVLVTQPEALHPNSLAVLANAASEGGHLQMDGRPVATKRALFLFLVQHPAAAGPDGEAAVKRWLTESISARGSDAEHTSAVTLSFRRRVDAVLPVRRLQAVPPPVASAAATEEL